MSNTNKSTTGVKNGKRKFCMMDTCHLFVDANEENDDIDLAYLVLPETDENQYKLYSMCLKTDIISSYIKEIHERYEDTVLAGRDNDETAGKIYSEWLHKYKERKRLDLFRDCKQWINEYTLDEDDLCSKLKNENNVYFYYHKCKDKQRIEKIYTLLSRINCYEGHGFSKATVIFVEAGKKHAIGQGNDRILPLEGSEIYHGNVNAATHKLLSSMNAMTSNDDIDTEYGTLDCYNIIKYLIRPDPVKCECRKSGMDKDIPPFAFQYMKQSYLDRPFHIEHPGPLYMIRIFSIPDYKKRRKN